MIKFLLPVFLSMSFLFSYENLYLMEFDNTSRDYKLDSFSETLPGYIVERYSNLDYLNILYAPKIIPSMYDESSDLNNGILINGRFLSSYDNIIISFDAYDVNTWEKKAYRSYYCKTSDVECIEKALNVCIDESIIPLFCPYYDCMGKCSGDAKVDCNGDCNGLAKLDCEGICNGNATSDCKGTCWGSAKLDNCGSCDYDSSNDCKKDCLGVWGGDAYLNSCNICISDEMDESSGMDCLGVCDGKAYLDCNGDCNGTAFVNECNVCVGGKTNNNIDLGFDCSGECFGSIMLDACGVCGGDNSSCSDCMGNPNGNALLDNCGICDFDISNDCVQDCNGDWGGNAFLNECSVCVGGKTSFPLNQGLDCNGICWGNAKLDDCGICNGSNNCDYSDKINIKNNKKEKLFSQKNIKFFHSNLNSQNKLLNDIENYNSIEKNTVNLLEILDNIKGSLYTVNISDILSENLNENVNVTIPVEFSISDSFLDMFNEIPFDVKDNSNGTFIYKLNKNDFNLDKDFINYLSQMNYQIIPVIFLVNADNSVSKLIVDSWSKKIDNFNSIASQGIEVDFFDSFSPLISITPGKSSIQFNFQKNSLKNNYSFIVSKKEFLEYDHAYIDFFYYKSLSSEITNSIANY